MDLTTLITAIGASGALSGLSAWLGNRALNKTIARINETQAEMNSAQADVTSADYVEKIILQADKRVEQYEADAKNWRDKIAETEAYSKEQRMLSAKLRDEITQLKDSLHKSELKNRDLEHALVVADYDKCTDNVCKKRTPPRVYNKQQEVIIHGNIQHPKP